MKPHCLFPECTRGTHARGARGLCRSHYTQARNLIRSGTANEADLIKRGLLLKRKRRSGSSIEVFRKGSKSVGARR